MSADHENAKDRDREENRTGESVGASNGGANVRRECQHRHALMLSQNLISRAGRLLGGLYRESRYGAKLATVCEDYIRLHNSLADLIGEVRR